MKLLKFLSIILLVIMTVTASAQIQQIRTTSGKLVNYGRVDTLTTTSATVTTIGTLSIADNSAGILEVTAVGKSAVGDGITGKLIYRYAKASGTLTISSATAISAITADTGLSGGTFALTASSNNILIRVTGKASTIVKWKVLTSQFAP